MRRPEEQERCGEACSTEADEDAPLTAEERARLLAELEAEFEAAERSIREEGTISAEEFLKRRADYWEGVAKLRGEGTDRPPRRKGR